MLGLLRGFIIGAIIGFLFIWWDLRKPKEEQNYWRAVSIGCVVSFLFNMLVSYLISDWSH